jgi:hypothetical protein
MSCYDNLRPVRIAIISFTSVRHGVWRVGIGNQKLQPVCSPRHCIVFCQPGNETDHTIDNGVGSGHRIGCPRVGIYGTTILGTRSKDHLATRLRITRVAKGTGAEIRADGSNCDTVLYLRSRTPYPSEAACADMFVYIEGLEVLPPRKRTNMFLRLALDVGT